MLEDNGTDIVTFAMGLIDRVADTEDRYRDGYKAGWDAARESRADLGEDNLADYDGSLIAYVRDSNRRLRAEIDELRSKVHPSYAQRVAAERLTLQLAIDGLLEEIAFESNPAFAAQRAERDHRKAEAERAREEAKRQASKARLAALHAHPDYQEHKRLEEEQPTRRALFNWQWLVRSQF
jgi:hypothetical protein